MAINITGSWVLQGALSASLGIYGTAWKRAALSTF